MTGFQLLGQWIDGTYHECKNTMFIKETSIYIGHVVKWRKQTLRCIRLGNLTRKPYFDNVTLKVRECEHCGHVGIVYELGGVILCADSQACHKRYGQVTVYIRTKVVAIEETE